MRKSLRLLLGVLVLLPVIAVMPAAGRATNATATGAAVHITTVQTTGTGTGSLRSLSPRATTRYRWVRVWIEGFNFTRQTLTLQCKLDKAAWARCGAFKPDLDFSARRTFTGLAPGLHTIRVRLVDPAGNAPPPLTAYPYGNTQLQKAPTVFSWFVTRR